MYLKVALILMVSISSFAMKPVKYSFIPSDFESSREYIQVETHYTHNFAEDCALKVKRKKKEIASRGVGEIGNARIKSAMVDTVTDEEMNVISKIYNKALHKITQEDIELYREFDKCTTSYEKKNRVFIKKCKQTSENSVRCQAMGDTYGYTEDQITRSSLMNLSIAGGVALAEAGLVIFLVPRSFGLAFMATSFYLRKSVFWRTGLAYGLMTSLSGIAGGATTASIIGYGIDSIDMINPLTWYDRYKALSFLDENKAMISEQAQLLDRSDKDMLKLSELYSEEAPFEVINYMDYSSTELKEVFSSSLSYLKSSDSSHQ